MLPDQQGDKRMTKQERAAEVFSRLSQRYPAPEPALDWTDAWQLLVATVLAAQCTDERVNKVTPHLFARWPSIADMAAANVAEVQEMVRSTGFFRNKGKNLVAAAGLIMEEFQGQVPQTMAELVRLPGVARKTANIVLSNAFHIHEGIAVDTHVKRLSFRLGLTENTDPVRIEKDLMPLFPREQWGEINHFLVYYGREVCKAQRPRCPECELADICPQKGVN
jgi:endonuclease-3